MPYQPCFPTRPSTGVVPFVTAAQAFPALERQAIAARRSIWLAFRIFDPETRLVEHTEVGATWGDLLAARLREGVEVRVILSDFDPVVAPELHEATWRAVSALRALAPEGRLSILATRHEGRAGRGLRFALWPLAIARLEAQRRSINAAGDRAGPEAFAARPGIWRYLRQRSNGRTVWRVPPMPRLYPITHHQKFAVFDGASAIIGGLDVNDRRFDDPAHQRRAEETWHDVSVTVGGAAAADLARHFADCWNAGRYHAGAVARECTRHCPVGARPPPPTPSPMPAPDVPHCPAATAGTRVVRTVSTHRRRSWLRLAPQTRIREIEEAHLDLIARARTLIYIETQFLRSTVIATALTEAAARATGLGLIVVLPGAPEPIAFDGDGGLPHRFGEYLQARAVGQVGEAFGQRACFVSPVRPVPRSSDGRDALAESGIIYVHSKVMIVDDAVAIVSSSNLNGRSLRWDTEAGVMLSDRGDVARLRDTLWRGWLPAPADPALLCPDTAARAWRAYATENARRPPPDRDGFLVPYDVAPARRIGILAPLVPEEFV